LASHTKTDSFTAQRQDKRAKRRGNKTQKLDTLLHKRAKFMFDKFIIKVGEYGYKVDRTLANQVDKKKNMINDYLSGRAYIESVMGS
jgi:hypothetical protein